MHGNPCTGIKRLPRSRWNNILHLWVTDGRKRHAARYMILKTRFFILLISLTAPLIGSAQSNQVWGAIELTKNVSDPWDIAHTVSWRQSVGEMAWRRALAQTSAIYSVGIFKFMGTGAVYYTTAHKDPDLLEIRPWQGVAAKFPDWKRMELVHFLRFEERFQLEEGDWSFSPRVRYEASTRIAISHKTLSDATWYLYGALEWLNNFNKPLDERFANTRASSAGIGHRFSQKSRLEAIYEADVTDNVREDILDVDVRIVRIRWLKEL